MQTRNYVFPWTGQKVSKKQGDKIVLAVNAHDDLVEAIQYALGSRQTNCVGTFEPTILGELRTMLEKALAKAEGK